MSAILSMRGLDIRYGNGAESVHAVRGVDLDLEPGQTLGIAGESGSGKTTLALSLLRLLPRTARVSGSVMLDGDDVLTTTWSRVRALRWAEAAVVFQGAMNALNPVRSIGEQLVEPILLHEKVGQKAARERAADLLNKVGVPERRLRDYPHELSGGQRQRVMIAMALACRPALIIADEPTTALDVIVQSQILGLIAELVREEGTSMIMISHDLAVLSESCDRLAVMYAGSIVELGSSAEVVEAPAHPYTRALAGAFPTIGDPAARRAPVGLRGDPPDLREEFEGCPFAERCPRVVEACRTSPIPLEPLPDGRLVACIRAHEPVSARDREAVA